MAATAKHFALNDNENNRYADSGNTTDANIRDYHTNQLQSLTENAHVSGVVTSYNAVNQKPSPADTYTASELLQRTYGYTTSDCGAIGDAYSSCSHGWAPPDWTTDGTAWMNSGGGQAYAERAGIQLNCTGAEETLANIQTAISAGVLSESAIDYALVHLFTLRMEMGEFAPRSKVAYTGITKNVIQSPAHQALAERVAANDLVLMTASRRSRSPSLQDSTCP